MIELPVLMEFLSDHTSLLNEKPLKNTVIVYIHHALQTSINVLSSLILLGAKPHNIYVLGKSYSENKDVVSKIREMGIKYLDCSPQKAYGGYQESFTQDIKTLWSLVENNLHDDIKDVMVLDHGGHAIANIPKKIMGFPVIGIEKTSAGTMQYNEENKPSIPLINVAGSAAKRWLESPLIAQAIVNKMANSINTISDSSVCAVIGHGAIGQAVSSLLRQFKKSVIVYDKHDSTEFCSIEDVIEKADYIFGCTGTDITAEALDVIVHSKTNKVFLSCSSEDKEFLSLLKHVTKEMPFNNKAIFNDISYKNGHGSVISIMRGGFPVNFDNSGESVPAQDIQLTRTLVMAAVLQAIMMRQKKGINNTAGLYSLTSMMQQRVVSIWCNVTNWVCDYSVRFQNTLWVQAESLGHPVIEL